MLKRLHVPQHLIFTAPVIFENIATVSIGLVFSSIIGGISVSALAAVGLVTSVMNALTALSAFITTGSAVITARLVGEGNRRETTTAVEQAMFLAFLFSLALTAVCELTSQPVMRLLLPNAEESVFQEGLTYYRVLLTSMPMLLLCNTAGGILRASGDSTPVMVSNIIMNLVQLLASYLLISVFKLDIVGAGLSYVICRAVGAVLLLLVCLRNHRHFHIRFLHMLRPVRSMLARIVRLGTPIIFEQLSIQGGYLLMNALAMSLGTIEASAYQVTNTLGTFANLPQSISIVITITLVGNALGAGDIEGAKRSRRNLHLIGIATSLILGVGIAALGPVLVPLYTQDPVIQQRTEFLLWLQVMFYLPGITINVNDPALRTGGDTKFVMWNNLLLVWLIRLPLSYLFCYGFHWGAAGVFAGNLFSVTARAISGQIRVKKGKWLTIKV